MRTGAIPGGMPGTPLPAACHLSFRDGARLLPHVLEHAGEVAAEDRLPGRLGMAAGVQQVGDGFEPARRVDVGEEVEDVLVLGRRRDTTLAPFLDEALVLGAVAI